MASSFLKHGAAIGLSIYVCLTQPEHYLPVIKVIYRTGETILKIINYSKGISVTTITHFNWRETRINPIDATFSVYLKCHNLSFV